MNRIIIMGIVFFLSGKGWSQETFTLEAAKAYALENNWNVKNALLDIKIAEQKVIETRGMGLPQVNLNGSFSNFINLPVQVIDAQFFDPTAPPGTLVSFRAGTDYSSSATFEVGQLLFNGSYIIGLQASRYYANFQVSAANITKEEIVFNVIQAYQLAAIAKENLNFVDSMVSITEKLIEKQENYAELGLMKQEDMDQLLFSLSTAKEARVSAELQCANTIDMLKFAMGFPMDQPLAIQQSTDELINKPSISNGNIKENLTYTLLEKKIGLSEFNVTNNKFANLPTLNAFFSHSYNAYRNEFDFFSNGSWFDQTVWGLQLNVPVFSGLSRHARTSQAKVELLKDQNSLSQMEQTLKFQEQQAKNHLTGAQTKHDLQKQNIELARKLYDNAITREEIGEGNSIAVTQKYNQLMVAQAQYIGSLVDLFQAKLTLDKLYNSILPNE